MADATESLAVRRRRQGQQEEARSQRTLVALLTRYLPNDVFWSSLENRPRSAMAGLHQKLRGCRSGLPDVVVLHKGRLLGLELKSRRGVASAVQRATAEAIQRAGGRWWLARSANAALVALRRSGVRFRAPWKPPKLEPWEGPTENPRARLPQHPGVRLEQREALRRYRERRRAREIARRAEPSIPGPRAARPEPSNARA